MNPYTKAFANLFERDLITMINEVLAYEKEENLWKSIPGTKNPGGNLAMHVAGNLRHFIGHVLNDSGYKRKRDEEFGLRDVPRDEIIEQLETASSEVRECLEGLKEERLNDPYPIDVMGYETSVAHFLTHLYGHLNYHLGQLNYHRRSIEAGLWIFQ